eukprot:3920544-Prymnesium_polylepis.1
MARTVAPLAAAHVGAMVGAGARVAASHRSSIARVCSIVQRPLWCTPCSSRSFRWDSLPSDSSPWPLDGSPG